MIKPTEKFELRRIKEKMKVKEAEAKNDGSDTERRVKKEREGRRE